ncbi:MAG: hypothetical protein FOGNACKC_05338 [Anaerolineae bacterium]|nr:hypothetical protein [Anaerolineae bacterium]
MSHRSQNAPRSPAVILFGLIFAAVLSLYGLTLAPGVVGGDAGEHQLAVPLLGIPHTTGYPLYVLTGKLWTLLLPVGSMAWRMNLFSALGGALAAATTALAIYRLASPQGARWPGAVVGGLALACGLMLWQWSTIAGVRSFNIFFFALLTLLAVIWVDQRRQRQTEAATRTLRWLALVIGLSLAHHRTTIFYLSSLAGLVLWYDRTILRRPAEIGRLALLAVAPLLLYAFIYFRGVNNPPYSHEKITDLQSFWFLVGSGDSTGLFFSIDPAYLPARLHFIWLDVLAQLSWPGVGLALVGAALLARRQTAHFLAQAALVILLLLFTLDFEVVNLNEAPTFYLMPAYFVFALWLGYGVNGILDVRITNYELRITNSLPDSSRFTRHSPPATRHSPFAIRISQFIITIALLALLAYSLAWPNWIIQRDAAAAPLDDWRQLLRGMQAQRLVEASLPDVRPNSLILGDWEQITPFWYYQLINGQRRDVTARLPLDRWPEQVAAARAAGQPVYFARKTTDLIGTPNLSMAGPLIYLGDRPQTSAPPNITPMGVNFENELELLGYRAQVWPRQPGDGAILQVTLFWRAPQKLAWDYALSLRLLDAAGREFYKKDAQHPVLSSYPTALWSAGEVVADFYELPLPAGSGPVSLQILPYRTEGPGQWYNLTPAGATEPGVIVGPFTTGSRQ